jgi:hypothetical protein
MSQIYGHWPVNGNPYEGGGHVVSSFQCDRITPKEADYTYKISVLTDTKSAIGNMTGFVLRMDLPEGSGVESAKLTTLDARDGQPDSLTFTMQRMGGFPASTQYWMMWFSTDDADKVDFSPKILLTGQTEGEFRLTKKRTGDSF